MTKIKLYNIFFPVQCYYTASIMHHVFTTQAIKYLKDLNGLSGKHGGKFGSLSRWFHQNKYYSEL